MPPRARNADPIGRGQRPERTLGARVDERLRVGASCVPRVRCSCGAVIGSSARSLHVLQGGRVRGALLLGVGEEHLSAIAVGTTAESATTVTGSKNCVPSMIRRSSQPRISRESGEFLALSASALQKRHISVRNIPRVVPTGSPGNENPARRGDQPKMIDLAWTRVLALVFP
jgi:hypothetical protein